MSVKPDKPDMISSGVSKEHIPFGRFAVELHSNGPNNDCAGSKSLSEGLGNISIYDGQVSDLAACIVTPW